VTKLASEFQISNIEFLPNVPYAQLNDAINEFDICLGVFGESYKTDVVIPNKIYHYARVRKCIITKDSPAIKEIFKHDENIYLVKNDPEELSEAILSLSINRSKRNEIASSAYSLISEEYNQDKIAEMFVNFLRTCF